MSETDKMALSILGNHLRDRRMALIKDNRTIEGVEAITRLATCRTLDEVLLAIDAALSEQGRET